MWTTAGYSDFVPGTTITIPSITETGLTNPAISVQLADINITKVVLHNGATAYDYTQSLSQTSTATIAGNDGLSNIVAEVFWCGFAVHDPRQNLHNADWMVLTPAQSADPASVFSLTGTGPYAGKSNAANNITANQTEAPSAGNGLTLDKETVSDPANGNISTAFIRNAPMESPWELGFIHRAARWQTINLKVYDTTKAFQVFSLGTTPDERYYIPGGGLYSSGDANILDQIKMTAEAESPQKIDLKSQIIDAATNRYPIFDALFSRIRLKSAITRDTNFPVVAANHMTIESMAGRNPLKTELTSVASGEIEVLGNAIMTKFNTASANEIRTRASVVDQLVPPGGGVSDAAQEELIGKIINLTKVSDGVSGFKVIILAQTIKDIGGTGGDVININKYSANGDLQESNCQIGQFNVHIDSSGDYKDNVYFDEITAEQKIQVDCVRNSDGTITIKKFQYID